MNRAGSRIGLGLACSLLAWGQQSPTAAGVPAHMIVTAGHYYSHQPPLITSQDLVVTQQYEPLTVTGLVPLRGDRAALESTCWSMTAPVAKSEPSSKSCAGSFCRNPPPPLSAWRTFRAGSSKSSRSRDRSRARHRGSQYSHWRQPANPFVPLKDLIQAWDRDPLGIRKRAAPF